MSRYGLIGMAGVIALFMLALLALAPKAELSTVRRLSNLGAAIEVYTVRHDGLLPPSLDALADEGFLPRDFIAALSKQVKYVAAGRSRDALSSHGIVALQDPAPVAGSILVAVLLADGAVLSVPADVVREAARRTDAAGRFEAAADGQLTVRFAGAD